MLVHLPGRHKLAASRKRNASTVPNLALFFGNQCGMDHLHKPSSAPLLNLQGVPIQCGQALGGVQPQVRSSSSSSRRRQRSPSRQALITARRGPNCDDVAFQSRSMSSDEEKSIELGRLIREVG